MAIFTKDRKIDLMRYIPYFTTVIFFSYFINIGAREKIFINHINKLNNEIGALGRQVESSYAFNNILISSLKDAGREIKSILSECIELDEKISLVAVSKRSESVFARSQFNYLIETSSKEINLLSLLYVSDYESNFPIGLKVNMKIPEAVVTPVIYIINKEGIVLAKYIITSELTKDELLKIHNLIRNKYF